MIGALLGAAVIGLSARSAWRKRMSCDRVVVSGAISWQQRRRNSREPAAGLAVTLETPSHRSCADAEVYIEKWTDDIGVDLLIPTVRPCHLDLWYTWDVQVLAEKGGSNTGHRPGIVPAVGASYPTKVRWLVGSPVEVSPLATSVKAKGYVRFCQGQDLHSVRIEADHVRQGTTFFLGDTKYLVESVDDTPMRGAKPTILLQSSDCRTPLVGVRFVDREGNELVVAGGQNESWKQQLRLDGPLVRRDRIESPPRSSYAAMIVEYWSDVWTKTIPFDVTVPLARQAAFDAGASVSEPTDVLPPPSSGPYVEAVPEKAWGPSAGDDPARLFKVVWSDDRSARTGSGFFYRFEVRLTRPMVVASYDVAITSCRDDLGKPLFRSCPARSAERQHWLLGAPRYGPSFWTEADPGQQDWDPWFELETNQIPSSGSTSVDIEGVLKLKIADELKAMELDNVSIGSSNVYQIGPVQLRVGVHHRDGLELFVHGDPGLIRELAFLSPDGKSLCDVRRYAPPVYWTNNSAYGTSTIGTDAIKAISRIRAEYYADCRHYVLPFKVTVPLKKQD